MKEYLTYISPRIVIGLALVLIVNWISGIAYKRFDLTQDQRYTLSESTVLQLQSIEAPLYIDVLLEGNFPSEFKRLQLETLQLLEEYRAINKNIHFNFVNPLEDEAQPDEVIKNLFQMGLTPANVTVTEGTKTSEEVVFPWAIANYGERSVKVPLLKNKLGADSDQRILNSVQHLEYAFTDAIAKLLINEKQKIAVLKGNGQLEDIYIADFITQLRDYYHIAPFTLDSVATNPIKTAQQLNEFDLLLVANQPSVLLIRKNKSLTSLPCMAENHYGYWIRSLLKWTVCIINRVKPLPFQMTSTPMTCSSGTVFE